MKRLFSLFLALLLLSTSLLALSSCGIEGKGAEISVYLSDEIYDFDPAMSYTDDNSVMLISMLFEPLFTLDEDGRLQMGAAKDYYFDRETGDLYIELRESYWSGSADSRVLAGDFVYAWRRIIDPDFNSPAATLLYDIKNAQKIKSGADGYDKYDLGVNSVDYDTIRIEFENEDVDRDAFLRNLASVMLSPIYASNVEKGQGDYWTKTAGTLYCNGAFKLQQLNYIYGYLTLARNDGYHRPSGSTRAIDYYVTPALIRTIWKTDKAISKADHLDKMYEFVEQNVVFYVGSLDWLKHDDSDTTSRADLKKVVETVDRLSTYTYVFNHENPLFASAEVRQILSKVIDRNQIIEDYVVFAKAATGLRPEIMMNHTRRSSFREYAGNLIETMSIEDAKTAIRAAGGGEGSFTITYNSDHPEEEAVAVYIRSLWIQLGYTINIKGVSSRDLVVGESTYKDSGIQNDYESGQFDVIGIDMQMMSANPLPVLATLTSNMSGNSGGMNHANWKNTTYDSKIEEALGKTNAKERASILQEAEKLLIQDEMAVIPLYFKQTYYVQNSKLSNVDFDYNGFPVFTKAELSDYSQYFFEALQTYFFPVEEEEE